MKKLSSVVLLTALTLMAAAAKVHAGDETGPRVRSSLYHDAEHHSE